MFLLELESDKEDGCQQDERENDRGQQNHERHEIVIISVKVYNRFEYIGGAAEAERLEGHEWQQHCREVEKQPGNTERQGFAY